jgi:hypothetical protein
MGKAQDDIEGRRQNHETVDEGKPGPAEGPHARKDLTDMDKTPGAGALVDKDNEDGDVDGGVG